MVNPPCYQRYGNTPGMNGPGHDELWQIVWSYRGDAIAGVIILDGTHLEYQRQRVNDCPAWL